MAGEIQFGGSIERLRQCPEGESAKKVALLNAGSTLAERVEREVIEVGRAKDGIGMIKIDGYQTALVHGIVVAGQEPPVCSLICDRGVVDNDLRNGAGSEIVLVKLIVTTMVADVRSSEGGQGFGFQVAVSNGSTFSSIRAIEHGSLLEVEFALGDVGDGDGDGMGVVNVDAGGIGGGLNGVADTDDLETRDGLEGESSPAGSGEIVQGGYCEGVRLSRGQECNFRLQTLPSCSAVTFPPEGMTTQKSSSERWSVEIKAYENRNREYRLMNNTKNQKGGRAFGGE